LWSTGPPARPRRGGGTGRLFLVFLAVITSPFLAVAVAVVGDEAAEDVVLAVLPMSAADDCCRVVGESDFRVVTIFICLFVSKLYWYWLMLLDG